MAVKLYFVESMPAGARLGYKYLENSGPLDDSFTLMAVFSAAHRCDILDHVIALGGSGTRWVMAHQMTASCCLLLPRQYKGPPLLVRQRFAGSWGWWRLNYLIERVHSYTLPATECLRDWRVASAARRAYAGPHVPPRARRTFQNFY
ncbi:hypothetical protein EVAR_8285_1 [Eumeta japonica]|uniref:Uncharacterized protein n=1 Tax=Eumeta variegata TaxID=151549 RepID=A0A4C1YAM5_EUMVA|nr:hypothetical protein EVAR_8285_1 [Eumeta japonica]